MAHVLKNCPKVASLSWDFFVRWRKQELGGRCRDFCWIFTRIFGEKIQFDQHVFQWVGSTTNQDFRSFSV